MSRLLTASESLSGRVANQDAIPENRAIRQQGDLLHVSSAIRDCPRSIAINRRLGKVDIKSPTGADRIVWTMGRAAEKHWRDSLIRDLNFAGCVGKWQCDCKITVLKGLHLQGAQPICPICQTSANNYNELTVSDQDAGLTGNPDFLLITEREKLLVVEIKSMNAREFDALTAPNPDHIMQATAYHRIAGRSLVTLPEHMEPEVRIVYIKKDYTFVGSVYKEFSVDCSSRPAAILDQVWQDSASVIACDSPEIPLPPKLSACGSPTGTTPKKCSNCTACFSL